MRKKVKSAKRALLRAALLRARGRRDKPCSARFKNEASLRFSRGVRRAVPPPVCARRSPCARCSKKRTPKNIFLRREKPKHQGHVTRTFPTSYGSTSTFQLSVFSFFVYSFFDAELQWKTDNLCGLISVMLRDRPCQASAWLRPLPCLTKIILANLCLLPIAIQHPARERERMDPPEAPYGKSERQRTIHTAAKKRIFHFK